jgi:hypothetical protein
MRTRTLLMFVLLAGCASQPGVLRTNPSELANEVRAEDALDLQLGAVAHALREQGFVRGTFEDRGFLPTSGRVARSVLIAPQTCARFVAVATPSIIDLDASLYRADGAALIEDDGSDARPSLDVCAGEVGVAAYYALHAYQGVGAYATAQFVRPAISGDDLMVVEAAGEGSALAELSKSLSRRGFEDAAPRVELNLTSELPVRVALPVKEGQCYTLAVEAAPALEGLSLRLLAGDGRELAVGVAASGLSALQYCAERSEDLAFELGARAGKGKVRVGRFQASHASLGGSHALWLGEPSPSAQAWDPGLKPAAELRRELQARGAKSFVVEERALSQGQVAELEIKRSLGPCETWRALLLPGLSRATLRVESREGHLYGEAESEGARAEVQFCQRAGPIRVSIVGRAGFGTVTLVGEPRDAAKAP